MTFDEVKTSNEGKRLVVFASPDGSCRLFAGAQQVSWPDDWPSSGINREFFEESGVELLRAAS